MTLGERIKQRRTVLGYSQKQVADALHISYKTLSKWENDHHLPDIYTLSKLASILGLTIDDLMGNRIEDTQLEYILSQKDFLLDSYGRTKKKYVILTSLLFCYMLIFIFSTQIKPCDTRYRMMTISLIILGLLSIILVIYTKKHWTKFLQIRLIKIVTQKQKDDVPPFPIDFKTIRFDNDSMTLLSTNEVIQYKDIIQSKFDVSRHMFYYQLEFQILVKEHYHLVLINKKSYPLLLNIIERIGIIHG